MTRNVIGLLGIGFLLGFDVNWERCPSSRWKMWSLIEVGQYWGVERGESMGISRLSHSDRDRNVKVLNSVLELAEFFSIC
jgi:hypothetical protein